MKDAYEFLAYIARYWFALLALVVIWRALRWLRRDAKRMRRVRQLLPDAGTIGEWVVTGCEGRSMHLGDVLPAPGEGWLGSARGCDVRVRHPGAPARAARFILHPDGLHLRAQRPGVLFVDGEPVRRNAVLRHGATLTLGGVTLELRLFAGVVTDAPRAQKPRAREEASPVTALPTPALRMKRKHGRASAEEGVDG